MKTESAVVLLSSGLDSTVNLYQAIKEQTVVLALTIDYGQRAAVKELENSQKICSELNIPHQKVSLDWYQMLLQSSSSSLVNREKKVPVQDEVSIESLATSQKTAEKVWVPNRNGLFLNIAASYAETLGAKNVVVGFNKEEAATFPDNSKDFLETVNTGLNYSTSNQVQVMSYTLDENKIEIIRRGQEVGVNFDLVWPCYFGEEEICGECESCKRYLTARKKADENGR